MSKAKESKLDPFAERLDEWFGVEKKTLKEVQDQLRLDGCSVSLSRLSEWWEERTRQKAEERLLSQIASGAQQVNQVRSEFAQHAPPQLEMLIDLHRVLVMQMSTQAAANPEMIKLADQALRTVMEYVSGQTKARLKEIELAQNDRRIKVLEEKAARADETKSVLNDLQLTEEQRAQRIKEIYGRA